MVIVVINSNLTWFRTCCACSQHPQSVKRGIVECLLDRAEHLTTKPSTVALEKKLLPSVLVSNGYPPSFVRKSTKTKPFTPKEKLTQDFESTTVLPYIKGVSEILLHCGSALYQIYIGGSFPLRFYLMLKVYRRFFASAYENKVYV